jgi:hypothetical protein
MNKFLKNSDLSENIYALSANPVLTENGGQTVTFKTLIAFCRKEEHVSSSRSLNSKGGHQ